MSDVVIRVENLSKQYRLGLVGAGTLRDDLNRWWAKARGKDDPLLKVGATNVLNQRSEIRDQKSETRDQRPDVRGQRVESRGPGLCASNSNDPISDLRSTTSASPSPLTSDLRPPTSDYVWALRDINFEVKRGEVLGIIGANGAGKSTLLKLLSRVTAPTQGRIRVKGRIAALLEVGTGFHPELTGCENVYLNGAIMGMTRAEVSSRLDEIIDFSGCERYIDTPVKRYSSGMKVRLGFAVAAHLEPEILIVDEVLAVGDAEFQKKCLGKMKDVAGEGRTVLFVSHNMVAVRRLCGRAIVLSAGQVTVDDPTDVAVSRYLSQVVEHEAQGVCSFDPRKAPGDEYVRLKAVTLTTQVGVQSARFPIHEGFAANVDFVVSSAITDFHIYVRVITSDGIVAFGSGDWDNRRREELGQVLAPGTYRARCVVPGHLLNRGVYALTVMGQIPEKRYVFAEDGVLEFEISEKGGAGGGTSLLRPGIFRPRLAWSVAQTDEGRHAHDFGDGTD